MSTQQEYSIECSKNRTKGPLNDSFLVDSCQFIFVCITNEHCSSSLSSIFIDTHAMTHGMSVIDDEN